jgi:hypothetical protein
VTAGERALWIAVYAASWHQPTCRPSPGVVTDDERARWCMAQADRAVNSSRSTDRTVSDYASEVLG